MPKWSLVFLISNFLSLKVNSLITVVLVRVSHRSNNMSDSDQGHVSEVEHPDSRVHVSGESDEESVPEIHPRSPRRSDRLTTQHASLSGSSHTPARTAEQQLAAAAEYLARNTFSSPAPSPEKSMYLNRNADGSKLQASSAQQSVRPKTKEQSVRPKSKEPTKRPTVVTSPHLCTSGVRPHPLPPTISITRPRQVPRVRGGSLFSGFSPPPTRKVANKRKPAKQPAGRQPAKRKLEW